MTYMSYIDKDKQVVRRKSTLNINEYQELAMTTLNPELSKRDVLINSVMGLCIFVTRW